MQNWEKARAVSKDPALETHLQHAERFADTYSVPEVVPFRRNPASLGAQRSAPTVVDLSMVSPELRAKMERIVGNVVDGFAEWDEHSCLPTALLRDKPRPWWTRRPPIPAPGTGLTDTERAQLRNATARFPSNPRTDEELAARTATCLRNQIESNPAWGEHLATNPHSAEQLRVLEMTTIGKAFRHYVIRNCHPVSVTPEGEQVLIDSWNSICSQLHHLADIRDGLNDALRAHVEHRAAARRSEQMPRLDAALNTLLVSTARTELEQPIVAGELENSTTALEAVTGFIEDRLLGESVVR